MKKVLSLEVQKWKVEGVAGLMKMGWPLFSEHIIHHMEGGWKENQREDDASRLMANKLTQLQLSELSAKQKKDKLKVQAPVVMAEHPWGQPNPPNQVLPFPVTPRPQPPQYQAPAPAPPPVYDMGPSPTFPKLSPSLILFQ